MRKQYILISFLLCFFVWAVVVDNVVLPSMRNLKQDVGEFTRYRVKNWKGDSKYNPLHDEILVYAVVKNREQLYYIDYKPHFEMTLKTMAPGTPLQLRHVQRFPKFWKRHLYEVRTSGIPVFGYSPGHLIQQQKEIWKFTGIMVGAFILLAALGLINKPRQR